MRLVSGILLVSLLCLQYGCMSGVFFSASAAPSHEPSARCVACSFLSDHLQAWISQCAAAVSAAQGSSSGGNGDDAGDCEVLRRAANEGTVAADAWDVTMQAVGRAAIRIVRSVVQGHRYDYRSHSILAVVSRNKSHEVVDSAAAADEYVEVPGEELVDEVLHHVVKSRQDLAAAARRRSLANLLPALLKSHDLARRRKAARLEEKKRKMNLSSSKESPTDAEDDDDDDDDDEAWILSAHKVVGAALANEDGKGEPKSDNDVEEEDPVLRDIAREEFYWRIQDSIMTAQERQQTRKALAENEAAAGQLGADAGWEHRDAFPDRAHIVEGIVAMYRAVMVLTARQAQAAPSGGGDAVSSFPVPPPHMFARLLCVLETRVCRDDDEFDRLAPSALGGWANPARHGVPEILHPDEAHPFLSPAERAEMLASGTLPDLAAANGEEAYRNPADHPELAAFLDAYLLALTPLLALSHSSESAELHVDGSPTPHYDL